LEAPPPPPRRGGPPAGNGGVGVGQQTSATSFLQLSQDHLTAGQHHQPHQQPTIQPGMKLFPNYTPPIPPHHHNGNGGGMGDGSSPANHHYHQITYQTQTLAPLRLNQEHFLPHGSKTNTVSASAGVNQSRLHSKYQTHHHHLHHHHQHGPMQPGGNVSPGPPTTATIAMHQSYSPDAQLHHHHHHHHHPAHQQQQQHHHRDDMSDREDDEDDTLDVNDGEGSGQSDATSPPQSPLSPVPPELPIRNGLLANTLNHINNNNNSSSCNGPMMVTERIRTPPSPPVTPPPPSAITTGVTLGNGRKTLSVARHYH
ncbi:protein roadkill, partial [Anopheles funestus]|uniref:protein roadkill n=1 Tax=Anopheles funestus TaxID=62324 RepID=UPI0020C5F991